MKTTLEPKVRLGLLKKTFQVVDLLNAHPKGMRLSEVSESLRLPSSSLHHILSMLRYEDYVDQDPDTKRYFLGFKFLSISSKILENLDIRKASYKYLRELHQQINETVNLTVLRNGQVTFIDKIQKIGGLSLDTYLGFSTDPHAAASGKVLLSGLDENEVAAIYKDRPMKLYGKNTIRSIEKLLRELQKIRKHGYAIDNEEYYEGVRCVAAPIISRGKAVAAVSVTGSIFTMSMDRINSQIINLVKETAKKISAELPA